MINTLTNMKVKVRYLTEDGRCTEDTAPVVAEFWAFSRKHAIRKFKRLFLTKNRSFGDYESYQSITQNGDDIFWLIYV